VIEGSGSERLAELVETANTIARDVLRPAAAAEDAGAAWPEPGMRALQQAGLMALNVPEKYGGHGEGLYGMVLVSEALARESPSTALCFAMHCVGTAVIAARATDAQAAAYLEPIAAGEHITTLALSEPGTGANFYLPQAELRHTDGGFTLRGTKSFITNGGRADSYVTSVASEGAEGGVFSCVLVEAGDPNLAWGEPWDGFGMRANSSLTLQLEDVPLPAGRLLGREGDQLWYVFEIIAPFFLMAMAGTYLGVAAAALDEARTHLGQRRHAHSGELLGANPILSHRLGDLFVTVEQTRRLVYSAARRSDAGEADALLGVLACKAAAGDASVRVANEAMTLCGGRGYTADGRLPRMLRDARASHVMAPTTDMLKSWLGRALLGLPLV
jgi:isovaleryl-CoA dehydrogenase